MSKVAEARRKREQKLKTTRGRQKLVLVGAVLAVMLVLAGVYYLLNSDLWLLKTISITGNTRLSAERITKLAGLDGETNLMKVAKDRIEASIEADPWVARVVVVRDLPSRLEIAVTERLPFARVKQVNKLFTLDQRGYVLEVGDDPRFDDVPVINEIKVGRLVVGERTRSALLRGSLKSLAGLTKEIRDKVVWISVPSLDKLAFHTSDNIEIIYGDAAKAKRKNNVINQILETASDDIVHINVTIPENPVVRKLKS